MSPSGDWLWAKMINDQDSDSRIVTYLNMDLDSAEISSSVGTVILVTLV